MKNVLLLSALLAASISFTADFETGRKEKKGRFTNEDGNKKSLRLEANKENGVHIKRSTRIEGKNTEKGNHAKNSVNLSHFKK